MCLERTNGKQNKRKKKGEREVLHIKDDFYQTPFSSPVDLLNSLSCPGISKDFLWIKLAASLNTFNRIRETSG